jgi:chromosomal replication initiator protein
VVMTAQDLAEVWPATREALSEEVSGSDAAFLSLIKPLGLVPDGSTTTALIAVPSDFIRAQVENQLRGPIESALAHRLSGDVRLAVTVDETLDLGEDEDEDVVEADRRHRRP